MQRVNARDFHCLFQTFRRGNLFFLLALTFHDLEAGVTAMACTRFG